MTFYRNEKDDARVRVENSSIFILKGQRGQGGGGVGSETDRGNSTGKGGNSSRVRGQRLEWSARAGRGPQENSALGLELSGRGLQGDYIDSDSLSWFCVSVCHKVVFSVCRCPGPLSVRILHLNVQLERTALLLGGKQGGTGSPVGRGWEVIRSRVYFGGGQSCPKATVWVKRRGMC